MKAHTIGKMNLVSLVVIASLVTPSVWATSELPNKAERHQEAQLNEEIGFGTGLVIGGLLGGPIGAFVTSIAGNFIAKHINANDDIVHLEGKLTAQAFEHKQLFENHQQSLTRKLEKTEQAYQAKMFALSQRYKNAGQLQAENLLMSLQFSTGSDEIAPHYQEQISVLAQLLNQSPDMSIDLSGYTDLAGEEEDNQALSLARVESVKKLLMAQGVAAERINSFAFGEAAPVVANAEQEHSFYDRRVVLKLHNQGEQMAKN